MTGPDRSSDDADVRISTSRDVEEFGQRCLDSLEDELELSEPMFELLSVDLRLPVICRSPFRRARSSSFASTSVRSSSSFVPVGERAWR